MHVLSFVSLCLISLFLTGCGPWQSVKAFISPNFNIDNTAPIEDASKAFQTINSAEATSVIQDFAVETEKKHNLQLQQAKTYYDDGIHAIQLQFITQDLIEMCEARELIVDMTENLLAKLNQNSLLATDFANYPFRPSNLEIYITFESYFGRFVDPFYIRWICMEDGLVDYYTFDLLDNTKNKWHVRHEAYSTSREIVVYQREAERKYKEIYEAKVNVFGDTRYYPEGSK